MSLSSLPLECLEIVLHYLHEQGDRSTLARLLRVNKFFCSATLPFLYGSVFSITIQNRSWGQLAQHEVIRTLLRQRPRAEVSELLSAAFNVFPEQSGSSEVKGTSALSEALSEDQATLCESQTSKIHYLSFIRIFNFEPDCFGRPQGNAVSWKTYYPRRLAYMALRSKRSPEDVDAEQAEAIVWKGEQTEGGNVEKDFVLAGNQYGDGVLDQDLLFPPSVIAGPASWDGLRYAALTSTLRRDLTWTLCSPVFEQIQEIVIPLSDVKRYLDAVHRFRSLTSVIFKLDILLEQVVLGRTPVPVMTLETTAELEKARRKRNRQFKRMIEFVKRHGDLFPGQLGKAECIDDNSWPKLVRCPQTIQYELEEALPPIFKPRAINKSNCRRIASKIKLIDLDFVEKVHLMSSERNEATKMYMSDPSFLGRCRAMKSLCMQTLGHGSFQWAVQEKAILEEEHWASSSSSSATTAAAAAAATVQRLRPMAPLETVVMTTQIMFKDELHHIAQAFGETLTSLDFTSQATFFGGPEDMASEFYFGRGWRLPRLQQFRLSVPKLRLLPDPDFYADVVGKRLERLELYDKSSGNYDIQELQLCLPAVEPMPKLTYLTLQGWPALAFHPDTLHQTPNLHALRLMMVCGSQPDYIPPEDEIVASVLYQDDDSSQDSTWTESASSDPLHVSDLMEDNHHHHVATPRRPIWTWDWNLPHLSHFRLDGVMAFLFQFKMLVGCPTLQHLELNFVTRDDRRRVLTLQDFTLPASSPTSSSLDSESNSPGSGSSETRLIVAPAILRLSFQGIWSLDDTLRSEIFPKTFPNLESFRDQLNQDSSIPGWVSSLGSMPRLKKAYMSVSDSMLAHYTKIMEECGLVRNLIYRKARNTPYCTEATVNNEQETILFFTGRFQTLAAPAANVITAPIPPPQA